MNDTARTKPLESIQRKLRSLEAVVKDPAATAPERETAAALKTRLERKLFARAAENGDNWTGFAYRLGRKLQAIDRATAPPEPSQGTAKLGYRLGRALGAGLKKWRSI